MCAYTHPDCDQAELDLVTDWIGTAAARIKRTGARPTHAPSPSRGGPDAATAMGSSAARIADLARALGAG